jgi:hypothetical protein
MNDEVRELAEEHWKWVRSLIEEFEESVVTELAWKQRGKLFVDAFIHGYKYGKEDMIKNGG